MCKYIVRLWGEFNFALDHFFPKHFKYIFYITMILPYLTNAIGKTLYILYPFKIAYRLDLELFALNALWVFYLISYKLTEMIKNEWKH